MEFRWKNYENYSCNYWVRHKHFYAGLDGEANLDISGPYTLYDVVVINDKENFTIRVAYSLNFHWNIPRFLGFILHTIVRMYLNLKTKAATGAIIFFKYDNLLKSSVFHSLYYRFHSYNLLVGDSFGCWDLFGSNSIGEQKVETYYYFVDCNCVLFHITLPHPCRNATSFSSVNRWLIFSKWKWGLWIHA